MFGIKFPSALVKYPSGASSSSFVSYNKKEEYETKGTRGKQMIDQHVICNIVII